MLKLQNSLLWWPTMEFRHWVLAPDKLDVSAIVGCMKRGDRGMMRHLEMLMPYEYSLFSETKS